MAAARRGVRRRGQGSRWKGTLRLLLLFSLLLAINAYFFVFRRGTSLPDLRRLAQHHAAAAVPSPAAEPARAATGPPPAAVRASAPATSPARAASAPEVPARSDEGRLEAGALAAGESLGRVLARAGVPAGTASAAVAALTPRFDPSRLRPGQEYALRFDAEDRLRTLELRVSPMLAYRVERGGRGGEAFQASRHPGPMTVKVAALGGTLDGSLYHGVARAGEQPALAAAIADGLAGEVNLWMEARPGERWKAVVEKLELGDELWRYGRVLAIELDTAAGLVRGCWFGGEGGPGGFFAENGQALAVSPLRSPLRYQPLPPQLDRRRLHPTLSSDPTRLASDWAGPPGAAVVATAAGRVAFRGPRGGEGQQVVIAHPGGMETHYARLARLARGLEDGAAVRRGQVIGYLGSAGSAAQRGGPPLLRYAVRVGGHFVDPLRLSPVRDPPLPQPLRAGFAASCAALGRQLDAVEISPPPRAPRGG